MNHNYTATEAMLVELQKAILSLSVDLTKIQCYLISSHLSIKNLEDRVTTTITIVNGYIYIEANPYYDGSYIIADPPKAIVPRYTTNTSPRLENKFAVSLHHQDFIDQTVKAIVNMGSVIFNDRP
jgi:hypothetical protein